MNNDDENILPDDPFELREDFLETPFIQEYHRGDRDLRSLTRIWEGMSSSPERDALDHLIRFEQQIRSELRLPSQGTPNENDWRKESQSFATVEPESSDAKRRLVVVELSSAHREDYQKLLAADSRTTAPPPDYLCREFAVQASVGAELTFRRHLTPDWIMVIGIAPTSIVESVSIDEVPLEREGPFFKKPLNAKVDDHELVALSEADIDLQLGSGEMLRLVMLRT